MEKVGSPFLLINCFICLVSVMVFYQLSVAKNYVWELGTIYIVDGNDFSEHRMREFSIQMKANCQLVPN